MKFTHQLNITKFVCQKIRQFKLKVEDKYKISIDNFNSVIYCVYRHIQYNS